MFLIIALLLRNRRLKASLSAVWTLNTERKHYEGILLERVVKILNARAIAGDNNEPLLTKLITRLFSISDSPCNSMIDEFYGLANIHCYGLCDALRSEFPELSRKEITICGMLAMGFDLTTICMLAGYDNVTSYYNKRSMIRRTMGLDSSTDLEEYLSGKVAGLEENDRLRYINLINSL